MKISFNGYNNCQTTQTKTLQTRTFSAQTRDKVTFGYYYVDPNDPQGDGLIKYLIQEGYKKWVQKKFEKNLTIAVTKPSVQSAEYIRDKITYTYDRYKALSEAILDAEKKYEAKQISFVPSALYVTKEKWEKENKIPKGKLLDTMYRVEITYPRPDKPWHKEIKHIKK